MIYHYIQITTTIDSEKTAKKLATILIKSKLAACIQIIGPITSIYEWHNRVETTKEWQCIIKTKAPLYPYIEQLLIKHHPYDVPEIIATPIINGHDAYLEWVDTSVVHPESGPLYT